MTSVDSRKGDTTALYLDSNGNPIDFGREYRNCWQSSMKTSVKVRYIKETPIVNRAGIPMVKRCAYITNSVLWSDGKWKRRDCHIEPSQVIVPGLSELGKGVYLFDCLLPVDEEPKYDWHSKFGEHNEAIVNEIRKRHVVEKT